VVGRLLAQRGAKVDLLLLAPPSELGGATAANLERFHAEQNGGSSREPHPEMLERADLIVDAMLGTGASGPLSEGYAKAVQTVNRLRERGAKVVALDVPTGLSADTGRPSSDGGESITADLTVTFAHPKAAHVLHPGRGQCGEIVVVDIGVEPSTATVELSTEEWAREMLPRRAATAHKGDAGRILAVGGSVGLTGAIVLAAKAALRAGAGLVTAAVPESVNDAIEAAMVEPMTWPLPETPERALATEALPQVIARAREAQCLALGPGLSRQPESLELARSIVAAAHVPIVLDADGLHAFAGEHAARFASRKGGAPLVVTPHLGEMSRLTGRSKEDLEAARLTAPRAFAEQWNAVVVMKGAPTVIGAPDGRMTVNTTGNPGMATAGMGDVLTGVIAGFIAQGLPAYEAARLGTYVHGLAADVARSRVGTLSLVAGDVIDALPHTLNGLEHRR
jgi:NAD(P)H-hydrate epimerase